MIRVYMSGPHAHRTPLSYAALWPLFEDHITRVPRAQDADMYVFAHVLDIQGAPRDMIEDWRRRRRPVVLLSEEPFWDTIWGGQPLDPVVHVDTDFGTLPVIQLNHHTSDIFAFHRLPYYLLTHHRFANAYAHRFARNAAWSVQDWQDSLAARRVDVCFMFERRPEAYHAVTWPEGDIIGLCSWRTELALACNKGKVERAGQSWQGGESRLDMSTDWHLDKLVRLDRKSRMISAIENTHQPDYITEKLFDALACGSVALYFAGPRHRVHDLALPPAAVLNLYGLTPDAAAERVNAQHETLNIAETAQAMKQASTQLAKLCGDLALWHAEREALGRRVRDALEHVCDDPPG